MFMLLFNNINFIALSNTIKIKAGPTSSFNVNDDTVCAGEPVTVVFTGYGETTDSYFWDFGDATILSGNGQGPYNITWNTGGIKKISLYVYSNTLALYSDTTDHYVFVDKIISGISSSGKTTVCEGDTVTLFSFINNGCRYQWLFNSDSIIGEINPIYKAYQTGDYSVVTTNFFTACSVTSQPIHITVGEKDFPIDFSGNSQFITSPPFAVAFNNLTPETYKYNFKWSFGDGNDSISNNTPIFYIYNYSGLYDISLIAEDKITGCRDTLTKNGYIYCINGPVNPCNLHVSISSNIHYPTCPGDTVILSANTQNNNIKYQWSLNGQILPQDTNSICYATGTGYYNVMISDNICSVVSKPFIVIRYTVTTPVILSEGALCSCKKDSMLLFTPILSNYISVNWSNGCNLYNNYINQSGFYTVSTTDINYCTTSSLPYAVNAALVDPPEICIVLVDTSIQKNRIVWDAPPNIGMVDSFKIYKESSSAGIYNLLATVPNYVREYVDYNSAPLVHSDIYRLSLIDTCNTESLPGNFHKTTHLNVSPALPKGFALTWDHYQGFTFYKYYIYRGLSNSTLQLFDSIAYNPLIYTYTDTTSLQIPLYYMISAVKPGVACTGNGIKDMSGPYSQSLSNVIDNIPYIDTSTNKIIIQSLNKEELILFPNPANNYINIIYNSYDNSNFNIEIYDLPGNLLISQTVSRKNYTVNIQNLKNGIYLIKIKNKKGVYVKKFIKKN